MLVAMVFGLDPSWGMLAVPIIGWIAGFGWACFGISVAGFARSIENFNYIVSAVLTPLVLLAGSFFPLDQFPSWARMLANLNPLHHCVVLVRHAVFGWEALAHRYPRDDAEARRLVVEPSESCASGKGEPAQARRSLGLTPRRVGKGQVRGSDPYRDGTGGLLQYLSRCLTKVSRLISCTRRSRTRPDGSSWSG
jgi:hypothetical protein